MMKRLFTLLCALTLACAAEAKTVEAASPGGNLRLAVDVADRITYGLWSGEDKILENCTLSLTLADRTLGEKPRLRSVKRSSADEVLERRNPTKNASVRNRYNAVRLNFAGGYAAVSYTHLLRSEVTAKKFDGTRNRNVVASSEGRNTEAISPTGFTGLPLPALQTVSS